MKALGYIRVSTEGQADADRYGLDIQREAIIKYASDNDVDLVNIYDDPGVSGGLENRPGLGALLNALDADDVDTIIVYRLDRLARDLRLQENFIFDFGKRGVKLISITEPDLGSGQPERVLLRQILGSFAEYERAVIALRLASGRIKKAERGGYAGGEPPLGYVAENGNLAVKDRDAAAVRRIFELRAEGATLRGIAGVLTREGYKTKRGGKWAAATVKYILDNPAYHGAIRYGGIVAEGVHKALIEPSG